MTQLSDQVILINDHGGIDDSRLYIGELTNEVGLESAYNDRWLIT